MPEDILATSGVGFAKSRYTELEPHRENFLWTARSAAAMTIPHLMPPEGWTHGQRLKTPYQAMGAKGVNNLASKSLLSLFPANVPFFRMVVNDKALNDLEGDDQLKTKIERGLGKYEKAVMKDIEASGDRVAVAEILRHLYVAGNALMHIPKKGDTRVFHLDQYVVKRKPSGQWMEMVIKEMIPRNDLREDLRDALNDMHETNEQRDIELYTYVYRVDGRVKVYQEANGNQVPDSQGEWPEEKSPYIPLRYNRIDGESYGRGFVEEYLGDLISLDGLYQSIIEGSAAMAKILILLDPNGSTNERDVVEGENGAVIPGKDEDVSLLSMDKAGDFRVTFQTIQRIEDRLAASFLMVQSTTRDAERVTAEEVRAGITELEDALGATYSILAHEFQAPYVARRIAIMSSQGRLPKLPKGVAKPAIITGLEALGRGQDLRTLDVWMAGMQVFGPEVVGREVDVTNYGTRRATALGMDTEGLMKSEETKQKEAQQAQRAALMQQAAPEAVKQIGGAIAANQGAHNGQG